MPQKQKNYLKVLQSKQIESKLGPANKILNENVSINCLSNMRMKYLESLYFKAFRKHRCLSVFIINLKNHYCVIFRFALKFEFLYLSEDKIKIITQPFITNREKIPNFLSSCKPVREPAIKVEEGLSKTKTFA